MGEVGQVRGGGALIPAESDKGEVAKTVGLRGISFGSRWPRWPRSHQLSIYSQKESASSAPSSLSIRRAARSTSSMSPCR